MFGNKYEERKAAILERIDVKDYMWRYYHGLSGRDVYQSTVRTANNAILIQWPKESSNVGAHNIRDISGELYWKNQTVEHIPSNLGSDRGVIYYFVCNDCGHKVKYLYFDNYLRAPLCRKCCNLPYRQPTRPERRISRYIADIQNR